MSTLQAAENTSRPKRFPFSLDPRRSLRGQITILIAVVVVVLSLLLSIVSGEFAVTMLRQNAGEYLSSFAHQMSVELDRTMFERYREMLNVSQQGPFKDAASTSTSELRSFLETLQKTYPIYKWIGFADTTGKVAVGTGGLLEGQDVSAHLWFQSGQKAPFAGDVHEVVPLLASLLPKPANKSLRVVDISMPVYDRNGQFLGVLGAHLDFDWSKEITESLISGANMDIDDSQIEALILNNQATMLAGPSAMETQALADMPTFGFLSAQLASGQTSGYSVVSWPGDTDYMIGYSHEQGFRDYTGLGWTVVVRQPTSVAFAFAQGLRQQVLLLGLLTAIGFAVLGWLLSARVTGSITQIAAAAQRLEDNAAAFDIPGEKRTDEVGTLSRTLHTLVARLSQRNQALEQLNSTLEEQVAERTAAAESRAVALADENAERQKVEQEVRESEQRFRVLAESSLEGVVITDGVRILDCNVAFAEMFGYPPQDMIGMQSLGVIPPEYHEAVEDTLVMTGEPYETIGMRLDGSTFPIEMRGRTLPYRGQYMRVTSVRDLTELKQAEEAMNDHVAQLSALQQVNSDLSAKLDVDYVLQLALDGAIRLSAADCGYIALMENNTLRVAEVIGLQAPAEPIPVDLELLRFLGSADAFHHSAADPAPSALTLGTAYEEQFIIPLTEGNHLLGALSLGMIKRRRFGEEIFQFVQIVANRIAVAIVNARLYETAQQQLEQVQSLSRTLAHQAEHDPLTGLANRTLFEKCLSETIERSQAESRLTALLYVDLDLFKQVNDKLGHAVGDELLRQVAGRISASVRSLDTAARFGGDEFAVVLEVGQQADAVAIAERLVAAVGSSYVIGDRQVMVTCSVGLSYFPAHTTDVDMLMRYADYALYQAKLSGKNKVAIYDGAALGETEGTLRATLEHDLRSAIERNQLRVYYQPQLDLRTNRITGVEALVRWEHPQFGLIPPLTFIPIAESTGVIFDLGAWVLKEACLQGKRWHDAGFALTVAVNLSPVQLEQVDFAARLLDNVRSTGLPLDYLEVEITESLLLTQRSHTEALATLVNEGIRIAIDDFGTGFSTLSYLRTLPIGIVKIDRMFTNDLLDDTLRDRACVIIRAITSLAHTLDMAVIAEGVETDTQVEILRSLESDTLQGYLLSKPMEAEKLEPLLHDKGIRRDGLISTLNAQQ